MLLLCVLDTGAAFTFGKSKNQHELIPEKYFFKMDSIKQVCCGDRHTAILTHHGKLYTFGSNDWGQLGHGHNNPMPQPKKIKGRTKVFVMMQYLSPKKGEKSWLCDRSKQNKTAQQSN